jgi:hypothetical protein
MTYSDGQLEYPIDAEGREVEVVHPKLNLVHLAKPTITEYILIVLMTQVCASRRSKDLCINALDVVATSV